MLKLLLLLSITKADTKLVCTGNECVRETVITAVPAPKLQYGDYNLHSCYVRFEPNGKLTYLRVESKDDRNQTLNLIIALEKDFVLERKKFVTIEDTLKHDIKKIPCTDVEPEHMRDQAIYEACIAKSSKNTYKMYCEMPRKKKSFSNF